MKKIFTLASVFVMLLLVSCEKHVITFGNTDIDLTKSAQIRLVYDVPAVPSGSTFNITRLKYNDVVVSEISTALGGIFPNSAAKYHVVPIGSLKINTFSGTTKDVPQYNSTFTIEAGKWSAFIYQMDKAPLLIKDAEQFPQFDAWTDTVATISFVNLFHKADGVTPYGKLFLKGRRGAGTATSPFVYIDIAQSDYKQASALVPYKLIKSGTVWSGTESGMAFVLFDETGKMLQQFATSTATVKSDYSATGYSLAKGRNYVFHVNGKEGTNYATQTIRLSTIALN